MRLMGVGLWDLECKSQSYLVDLLAGITVAYVSRQF